MFFFLPPFFIFLFFWGGQGLLVHADLENFALTPQMLQIQVLPLYWILWNTGDEIQGFIHARQTLSQPISEAFPSDYLFVCLFVLCSPDCHQIKCSHSFSLPVCYYYRRISPCPTLKLCILLLIYSTEPLWEFLFVNAAILFTMCDPLGTLLFYMCEFFFFVLMPHFLTQLWSKSCYLTGQRLTKLDEYFSYCWCCFK